MSGKTKGDRFWVCISGRTDRTSDGLEVGREREGRVSSSQAPKTSAFLLFQRRLKLRASCT